MAVTLFRSSDDPSRERLRRKITSFLIALIIEGLIIIGLLQMGFQSSSRRPLLTTSLQLVTASNQQKAQSQPKAASPQPKHNDAIPPPHVPPPLPIVIKTPKPPQDLMKMSKSDFDATDISKLGSHKGDSQGGKAAYGPGQGPNGQPLYNAEWYREPTDGQMAYYLPANVPPDSWATVACRTIEHYHVEDCQSLSESPPGSGLSKALRLASWQFLVRPPRVGDKPMIGAWVRIRFNWTKRHERSDYDRPTEGRPPEDRP